MSERKKAKILQAGTINDEGMPVDFVFDCDGGVPGISLADEGWLFGGYTVDELRAVSETWPDTLEEKP